MYRGCGVGTISAVAPLRVAPAAPHQPAPTAAPPARGALVVMAHFVYAGRVGGAEHMLYTCCMASRRRIRELQLQVGSETKDAPCHDDTNAGGGRRRRRGRAKGATVYVPSPAPSRAATTAPASALIEFQ
jgi:hypothetical protein